MREIIKKNLGWIWGLLAVLLYSFNTPAARGALVAGISPQTLLAARFVLATALFGGTLPLFSLPGLSRLRRQKVETRPLDGRGTLICLASGFANGLMLLLLYWGLVTLAASLSSIIMIGTIAFFTMGILTLCGLPPRWIDLGRLGISLVGLILLLAPDGGIASWVGVAYTLGAAFFFSLHVVSVQLLLRPYPVWSVTALLVTGASIFAVILWWLAGADTFVPGWVGWGAIIFQAVIATYLGRLVTYSAVQLIGSDQFALLSPLETLLTIIWSVLFLGERLLTSQWVGALIIVTGALLVAIPWARWGFSWLIQPVRGGNSNPI